MSDFVLSTRRRAPGELRASLERFLAPVTAEFEEFHGEWGSLAIARAPHDPALLVEDDEHLTILVGYPIIRSARAGTGFPDDGPRRRMVHDLLASPDLVAWETHLDGDFAAVSVSKKTGAGRLVTDTFSFVTVFYASEVGQPAASMVIGSHLGATARTAGRSTVDPVAVADLVIGLTSTFPRTLFDGVEQAVPGTDRRFTASGWEDAGRVYWHPTEDHRDPASFRDLAHALREGFSRDVSETTDGLPEVGMLLSGGEDSRAVLGAIPRGVRVQSYVYADWESREVRVARAAARAYGSKLTVGLRTPNHYLDGFEPVAAMLGSGHLFIDVHGFGFHRNLGIQERPVVFGGLSADSLLKAYYDRADGPISLPATPGIRSELLAEVVARRTVFRSWLAEIRPASAAEWDTLWPFSMRRHGGAFDGNRRLFRSHEVFHSMAVLRIAASAPTEWKKHRRLYLAAMRPFFAKSWSIPHSEYRFPYFGRLGNLMLLPGLAVARGIRAIGTGEMRARHRPWPRWKSVARAADVPRRWRENGLGGSPIGEIFPGAFSPEDAGRAIAAWPAVGQLMLLQVARISALVREP